MKGIGPRLGEATPVVVRTGTTGCAVLLRYGAAVLFGLDELEESEFLERLMPFVRHRLNDVVSDELEIIIDPDQGERMDSFSGKNRRRSSTRNPLLTLRPPEGLPDFRPPFVNLKNRHARLFEGRDELLLDLVGPGPSGSDANGRDLLERCWTFVNETTLP